MGVDELLHDAQAEATAFVVPLVALGLIIAVEDMLDLVFGNAAAGVAHGHLDHVPNGSCLEDHKSALRRVPQRVVEEIVENLADARWISRNEPSCPSSMRSGCSSWRSTVPWMMDTGVRSSCDTFEMKARRIRSLFSIVAAISLNRSPSRPISSRCLIEMRVS